MEAITGRLQDALLQGQLCLRYQPVWETRQGGHHLVGFEALARWQHPQLGPLRAGDFIPFAAVTDQLVAVASWGIETVVEQLRHLHAALPGTRAPWVSLNLPRVAVLDPRLPIQMGEAVAEAGLSPSRVRIEVAASELSELTPEARAAVTRWTALGTPVVLDGYGDGRGPGSKLLELPITRAKLSRSLVRGLDRGTMGLVELDAVRRQLEAMRYECTATGIEDERQHRVLRELGVRFLQGTHLGRPLDGDECVQLTAAAAQWARAGDAVTPTRLAELGLTDPAGERPCVLT